MTTERATQRADGHVTGQRASAERSEGRQGEGRQGDGRQGEEQELLSGVALTAFRLNGQFLAVAEEMARPAGLTAAWWQVLGAVLHEPLPVSGIARAMGITRQSVQRIADLLVERGYAEYQPNPAHRRAKLVRLTDEGVAAVRRINPAHAVVAGQLAAELGIDELRATLDSMRRLSEALERIDGPPG